MQFIKSRRDSLVYSPAFALITTITIITLVVMVALALVSLATVSSREQSHTLHAEIARSNARLALAEAMASIQKFLGPDQRICANASILDADPTTEAIDELSNPEWLGVWQASPNISSYEEGRQDSFLCWLVSHSDNKSFQAGLSATMNTSSSVFLGEKQGEDSPGLRAQKIDINRGAFAWAITDSSQKSSANGTSQSVEAYSDFVNRNVVPRQAVERVEALKSFNQEDSSRIVSTDTVELALGALPDNTYWKASVTDKTQHLLTNVAHGGLKKDLNTLLELDRKTTDWQVLGYGTWNSNGFQNNANNYIFGNTAAKGATWAQAHSYYNLYKDISWDSTSISANPSRTKLIDWRLADRNIDYGDPTGGLLFPKLAKILYVYSYESSPTGETTAEGEKEYELKLVCNIFVALWNPYNLEISLPENSAPLIKFAAGVPLKFDWQIDDESIGGIPFKDTWTQSYDELLAKDPTEKIITPQFFYMYAHLERENSGPFRMQPGETVIFSMSEEKKVYAKNYGRLRGPFHMRSFKEGIDYSAGVKLNKVLSSGRSIKVPGSAQIQVGLEAMDNMNSRRGESQYIDFWVFDSIRGWPYYEERGKIHADGAVKYSDHLKVDVSESTKQTARNVDNDRQPFAAFIMELKTANDMDVERSPNLPFLHSGLTRLSSRWIENKEAIANERLQYRAMAMQSWDSDLLQVSLSNHPLGPNHIFIGGGSSQLNGQTHFVAKGIPLMAPTSIAEFMHAGLGDGADNIIATAGRNALALAPFFDLSVGNSYAHPMIGANQTQHGRQFDYSYKLNAELWDNYFCSSLAPRLSPMVESEQTISEVWRNFTLNATDLTNNKYVITNDFDGKVYDNVFDDKDALLPQAHKKIAEYLAYNGGFNVNSVSVDAWKSFLSGAINDKVKHYELAQNNVLLGTDQLSNGEVPFCRNTLPTAPQIRTNLDGGNIGENYLGYRMLSATEIDALAKEIVKQVKIRGPFLNMSDFINRQLNDKDTSLCLSGALQAAIDATSINDAIKSDIEINQKTLTDAGINYRFNEAAWGNTAKGSPGWLMQGDLLLSLGSSIFVRGDTFTIRTYGESRDLDDTIMATAYLETIVQRTIHYLDNSNVPSDTANLSADNQLYGRRFNIVQFRWLSEEEI